MLGLFKSFSAHPCTHSRSNFLPVTKNSPTSHFIHSLISKNSLKRPHTTPQARRQTQTQTRRRSYINFCHAVNKLKDEAVRFCVRLFDKLKREQRGAKRKEREKPREGGTDSRSSYRPGGRSRFSLSISLATELGPRRSAKSLESLPADRDRDGER
mmetsp:Transcript_36889/g.72537  ORF Transcript_36889/g.72537 Transcript_36889/m.72537 type:complete len:156 (+) Transcript_36889:2019-2486(+)